MNGEIQLICDGDGMAVIGDPTTVDLFLESEGLVSKELGLPRLSSALASGSQITQVGSEVAAASGRWVKLTEESAGAVKKYGLRESSKTGLSTGVLKGDKGQVKGFVEFAKGPGTLLNNPAVLAGAAGMMAQLAMQQAMDEITDYLAVIDEKVDDILRAQKDSVMARMIGVGLVIEEAMKLRDSRGRVDEVTWSKIQSAPATIAETQAYALRQLDALAEKLESKASVQDVAKAVRQAEGSVQEWLAVLARCFQLQDAIAVLELDRVLDATPDELDGHRIGLRAARSDRLALISTCTERLLLRLDAAAGTANLKVLLHPGRARQVVHARNDVAARIEEFQARVGAGRETQAIEARRWTEAATEVRDKALATGVEGVQTAKRVGAEGLDRAKSTTGRVAERARRWRGEAEDDA